MRTNSTFYKFHADGNVGGVWLAKRNCEQDTTGGELLHGVPNSFVQSTMNIFSREMLVVSFASGIIRCRI